MDITIVLITSFVVLIGLQICVPENPNGRFEDQFNEKFWTQNPWVRIFYGLSNIVGSFFVLGMVGYLTFSKHWWYFLVYLGALILAKLIALIFKSIIEAYSDSFSRIKNQRIFGSLVVVITIIIFLICL